MEPSSLFMRACDLGRHSFGYFSVAYMDVGKGREQDAEALLQTEK